VSKAKIGVLGLPWDGASSYLKGTADAPQAIRQAFQSPHSNQWSERGFDIGAPGAFTDLGDLVLSADPATCRRQVESGIADVLDHGFTPLVFGGDHSLSYPVLRAFKGRRPAFQVLHFDAHSDLYDDFEGDRYSHACPFARVLEEGLVQRLTQVGIRTMNDHQRAQASRFGVRVHYASQWSGDIDLLPGVPIYVSLDVDVLDPAFAPGISHREPGGLSTRQLIDALRGIDAPVIGADLVEYNPRADVAGQTGAVMGKLFKELIGLLIEVGA